MTASRQAAVRSLRASAIAAVQAHIRASAPALEEVERNPHGLQAWLLAAAQFSPQPLDLAAVTARAWHPLQGGRTAPVSAILAHRFARAGLAAPSRYLDAVRLAVLGHAIGSGLTPTEFCEGLAPSRLYRVCRAVAAPYYPSARVVLGAMRQYGPTWASERWLTPLLLDVPVDAWTFPRMLTPVVTYPRRTA